MSLSTDVMRAVRLMSTLPLEVAMVLPYTTTEVFILDSISWQS
jgi:hypothetical protein